MCNGACLLPLILIATLDDKLGQSIVYEYTVIWCRVVVYMYMYKM